MLVNQKGGGMPQIENVLFALPFLAVLTVGLVRLLREYLRFRRRTANAQGKVLRVRFGPLHLGTNVPRPEIEFVDLRGQRVKFHSRIGASWNPWPKGSSVQVSYDPEDPTNAEIKLTLGLILFGVALWIVFIFGCGLLAFKALFAN
jgi:hypothetical protein